MTVPCTGASLARLALVAFLAASQAALAAPAPGPASSLPLEDPAAGGERQEGYLRLADGSRHWIAYQVIDGVPVFEGDIVLNFDGAGELTIAREMDRLDLKSTGRAVTRYLWPNRQVFFRIDAGLPDQARVTDAIAHWEANTGLDFIPRTTQPDFVTFRPGTNCSSSVGRQGGQQFINLAANCSLANAIHEIGHAVGLWHEHTRADRDAHVIIHWNNIQAAAQDNYRRYFDEGQDGYDHGPYDFVSRMHYFPFNSHAIDPSQPVLSRRSGSGPIGGNVLSAGDVAGIAFLYGGGGSISFYEGNSGTQSLICQTVAGTMRFNFQHDWSPFDCPNDEARSLRLLGVPAGYRLRLYDSPSCSTNDDWTEIRVHQTTVQDLVATFESSFFNGRLQVIHHHDNGLDGKVSCVIGEAQRCGDGQCSFLEGCASCAADCGACPVCGDGLCSGGESCGSCPGDCGACPFCGDGLCNGFEDCQSCDFDCGPCPSCDFDFLCEPWEDANCQDCACGQFIC